jgi:hypothetical protein
MPKLNLPCKFGHHYNDWVPMPFGSGNCAMPGFECTYEGDIIIAEDLDCEENSTCPAYQPVDTIICKKHVPNTRHIVGYPCPTCEDKREKAQDEWEQIQLKYK